MNRDFQERLGLHELEMKLFNTGVLGAEEVANVRAIFTFVPPSLEMHLGSVQVTAQALRGAHDQEQIQDGMERWVSVPQLEKHIRDADWVQ